MDYVFLLGILAGSCTTLSFIPQVVRIWKSHSAKDISGAMYAVFALGSLLWFLYGLEVHALPVILANGITLMLNLLILVLKWKFAREKLVFPLASR